MSCDLWRQWLEVYVDESCTAEEIAAIEDHLRTCPPCTAATLARLQLKRLTRAAAAGRYGPSPEFRLRPEFFALLKKGVFEDGNLDRKPLWKLRWVQAVASAVVALLIVLVSISAWMRHSARDQALAELLDLHVATTASANPVDVLSSDRHTVKPWFQGKLPFAFNLPEPGNSSFKLLGGRLIYFGHAPGAQLLYDERKHQFSVFVLQENPGSTPPATGVTTSRQKGFSVETWSEAGLRYVIMSDSSASDVHDLGDLMRTASHQ
jgi:anti-sigma factor RsiW